MKKKTGNEVDDVADMLASTDLNATGEITEGIPKEESAMDEAKGDDSDDDDSEDPKKKKKKKKKKQPKTGGK